MFFYLFLTLSTTVTLFLAGKTRGTLKGILTCIALCVPCFAAACRDSTVGTDMAVYGVGNFQWASQHGFAESLQDLIGWQQPTLYSLLTCIDANIFHSLPVHLFILQALVILPLFAAAAYFSGDYAWVAMFWFMSLCYPSSLNIMKQSIAVSFVVLAFAAICQHKNMKALIWLLIGFGFHQTALVAACLLLCCAFLVSHKGVERGIQIENGAVRIDKRRNFTYRILVIVLMCAIFVVLVSSGSIILSATSSLKDSYQWSIEHAGLSSFSTIWFVFLGIIVLLGYIFYSGSLSSPELNESWHTEVPMSEATSFSSRMQLDFALFVLLFWGVLFEQTQVIATNFYRFALYGLAFGGIYFARKAREHIQWSVRYRVSFWPLMVVLAVSLLVLFDQFWVEHGADGVVPYTSAVLGIYA